MHPDYSFIFADDIAARPARKWLLLGVVALALAGLLALLLAAARTPTLAQFAALKQLFHVALVVHVDLSVLVWFLAFACMMWRIIAAQGEIKLPLLRYAALITAMLGTAALALSPLDKGGVPLMSNYIPVITSPVFFVGLALLFCSVLCALVELFCNPSPHYMTAAKLLSPARCDGPSALYFGIYSSGIIALLALANFYWSYRGLPRDMQGQSFYETVFWAGGHVLQFTHTQLLLVVWLALAAALGARVMLNPALVSGIFGIQLVAALASPIAYILYGVDSYRHTEFFTQLMIWGGGIGPVIIGAFVIYALYKRGKVATEHRALWSALVMSLLLFIFGGVFGMAIHEQNVTIPAHYHGSIVGVTIAFMGFAYFLLPKFGYAPVAHTRTAYWQPFVYGVGQLVHISALAWSGGYGVLRKTPGALEGGFTAAKAAMGIMGLGGLLAIIGGLMFVVTVARSVWAAR